MAATWPAPRDSATISRTSALVGGRRRVSIADVAHHAVLLNAQHEVGRKIVLLVLHHPRIGDGVDLNV
jgi:hypothetical protein